jgi:hypothetical protein
MIQVVLHYIILVDRGENTGDVIQADQVLHDNRIPGHPGIFVIGGDADRNKKNIPFDGLDSYLFSSWSKTM